MDEEMNCDVTYKFCLFQLFLSGRLCGQHYQSPSSIIVGYVLQLLQSSFDFVSVTIVVFDIRHHQVLVQFDRPHIKSGLSVVLDSIVYSPLQQYYMSLI